MTAVTKSHDLRLPDWGPYSKRYAGVSHIPDVQTGLRFDLAVVPGYYRRQMLIPSEMWASGHHAWEASPDLSYYAYRYEIEWKDQVYCDVSISALDARTRLIRTQFVNNTDMAQNLMLHLIGYMNFPPVRPYSGEAIRLMNAILPEGSVWIDALDYEDLQFTTSRPTDNLSPDGMLRAELRDHGLVHGSGIGTGFGGEPGDYVQYSLELDEAIPNAALVIRYRIHQTPAQVRLNGLFDGEVSFDGSEPDAFGFGQVTLAVGDLLAGTHQLRMTALTVAAFDLNGFTLVPASFADQVRFIEHVWSHIPKVENGTVQNSLVLHYGDTDVVYGVVWKCEDYGIRQLFHHELDSFLRQIVPDNETQIFHGSDQGHFTDIFIRPLFLSARSQEVIHACVCSGSYEEVLASLTAFASQPEAAHEAQYWQARQKAATMECSASGEAYRFSQERMAATELMNVVYPVYTQRQYIRHYTPGKWWDCLYTWDSGFIGLALLELDLQRAIDSLNAYTTQPGNPHAAFIHHGSPIPVQIYLFHELWNRTQDRALLERFYPSLRQYYLFLAGRLGSSTSRALKSNLLRTWEYFDDSGGWDDYPAQVYTWGQRKDRITCAAITAHVIRSARTLLASAQALGIPDDQRGYLDDIEVFSDALQQHAWDRDAGYFSYVVHDEEGNPTHHLRHESGLNFNMGLDGVMPLFAGICTPEQEYLFFERLQDPSRFWTPIGIAAVDQSAPYYRKDGYWNGAVWMPQQWFIWKTALDMGQGDFAFQIAKTALDLWQKETSTSYYCFEHFIVGSGRGAGWHQFGGLSSPVVSWLNAYHRPGRLTTGMNIWIEAQQFTADYRHLDAQLRTVGTPRTQTIIANMQPGEHYAVTWNGQVVGYKEINPGSLQIDLPFVSQVGMIAIQVHGSGDST
jgi:hypothetical protein